MSSFMNYALEANLGLVLFLGLYMILYRNENDFASKRFYLLGSMALSLTLPFLHIPVSALTSDNNGLVTRWLSGIVISSDMPSSRWSISWAFAFQGYRVITMILFARMLWQLVRLGSFLLNSSPTREGKFQLIETSGNLSAFSFFSFIVIGRGPFSTEERNLIIKHESIHAQKLHSLDTLLMQGLVVLFWFNPCVYIYRNILRDIHEFEADALTVKETQNPRYSSLLARVALYSMNFSFANHFNQSITLKRINMLNSIQKRIQSWKWFATAMTAIALFIVVACQDQTRSSEATSLAKTDVHNDGVYTVVDEVATPADGMIAYYEYISSNLQYPAQARKMGVEGKVLVEFIIQKDGSVTDVNVIKGIGAGCDKAAMDVIMTAPKWNPGKNKGEIVTMKMVMPIVFKLG